LKFFFLVIDAFAYFRAILHANELSERALELTTTCSQLNPANYSVWQFRRNVLKALEKDLEAEFKFTEEMIFENPKNYQIWHHRRVLVDWTSQHDRELEFTAYILRGDAKNYHAWQHRQWVVEKFNLFDEDEIDYSTSLLEEDFRNNSAWNYRYFIVENLSNAFKDQKVVDGEIEFVKGALQRSLCNESSWCYLNGLLVNDGIAGHPKILEFCQNLHDKSDTRSIHLRCLLFDYHKDLIEKSVDKPENSQSALKLLDELLDIDPVRKNYYQYLRERVKNLLSD
jgi:protein farnesyltransferase/geranylgeranyltransferase type-1 subunit alpha